MSRDPHTVVSPSSAEHIPRLKASLLLAIARANADKRPAQLLPVFVLPFGADLQVLPAGQLHRIIVWLAVCCALRSKRAYTKPRGPDRRRCPAGLGCRPVARCACTNRAACRRASLGRSVSRIFLVALSHTLDLEKVEVMVEEFITASSTIEPA